MTETVMGRPFSQAPLTAYAVRFEEPLMTLTTVGELMVMAGAVVSMTMALLAPRDPAAPGVAKVRVALLVAESLMVPPARARAEVDEIGRAHV